MKILTKIFLLLSSRLDSKLFFTFFFLIVGNFIFAQKVTIVGVNYSNGSTRNDAVAFVANQQLAANEVIYFNDFEYNATTNVFGDAGAGTTTESVLKFTASAIIPKGTVISLRFASPQTMGDFVPVTVAASSGVTYGSAAFIQTINGVTTSIGYRTGGESIYAYSDNDDNPTNGITEIFCVFYVGSESSVNAGGNISANESPVPDFPNAIVIDGFSFTTAELDLIEFTANRASATSKATLENPGNYTTTANAALNPNVTAFSNIFPSATLPVLTVTTSPSSIVENAAGTITYTFTLNGPASGNVTVNFNVGGTATFGTDYTQTGGATFSTTSGTIVIANGTTSASLTLDPSPDATLEPNETVIITAVSVASVYDAGSPSAATITIVNDDTGTSVPKVALVGINHADVSNPTHIDGFSFVALEDITSGTVVYFTRRIYDKGALAFTSVYTGTLKWTAAAGVNRGDVYTVMETSADVFTVTCSDGSSCGTITNIDASFSIPTGGITLFAYRDTDDNPTNGVSEIYSALHTGDLTVAGNGGVIPTNSNPTSVYPSAVVNDNFPNAVPGRVEYKFPSERQVTVNRTALVNVANWLHAQSTATAPSTVRFTNIIVTSGVANPLVTVNVSPTSVAENSGTGMVYTFTLSANATSNMTINFTVSGAATFGTDYTQSGATSFTNTAGSVVIPSGSNTASLTITPTGDATLEPNETVVLTVNTGTGYDAGNPNIATGTIANDDFVNVNPLVVIVGINHGAITEPDGLSFAANQNLTAGTEIYFTDSPYNNTTLTFGTIESIVKYTVPTGGLAKGQVVYFVETGQSTNAFTVTCSAGTNCGTITMVSGDFSISANGEDYYAYSDADADPTNGVTSIHSLFYSINGAIPATLNPQTIYPNAVVSTGFGNSVPNRTEYKFASNERASAINLANIQNSTNYLIAQTTQNLSVVAFAALNLCPASISGQPTNAVACLGANTSFTVTATGSGLSYQWRVNTGSGFTNIVNGGIYSGATSATLTLTNVAVGNNGYSYQCVVNDCTTSNNATLTVQQPQGNSSVFGTNTWNVYAWNAGGGFINANSWNANYSGFYTNSNLSFNSADNWTSLASPSSAANYQGCTVAVDNHSYSAKRQGFPCGTYQLDIPAHDDGVQLWINGTKVYEHDGCCDVHTNVWTGFLGPYDKVEFKITEGGGGSIGQLTFNLIASTTPPITTDNALTFDGVNDYVIANNCVGSPAINGGNAITVEYWFKGISTQSAVRSQADQNYMVAGWNGKHILSNDGGTVSGVSVGAAATDGNWHHVAFTWKQNTTNGFKSYLDGVLVEQRNSANVPLPIINNPLYLGAFQGSSEFMNGSLDEVRVWTIERTQAQIQASMLTCNFTVPQTGLLIYYKFDHGTAGGSNTTINRLLNSANNADFNGVLSNFSLTSTSSNWTASTFNPLPTLTLTSPNLSICQETTSFTLPYTTTTGTPNTYSISGTGITSVTNATLPASPIVVSLSNAAVFGTNPSYTLTVKNANGCTSSNMIGTVTVNAKLTAPTVTPPASLSVCSPATLTLTANGCAGTITWSNGATGTSIILSSAGTYTISATCTVANCVSNASTVVSGLIISPLILNLVGPTDNLTGTNLKKAGQAINASNKITSPANVVYQAGNNILLTPGFETGAVFRAEIQGCGN